MIKKETTMMKGKRRATNKTEEKLTNGKGRCCSSVNQSGNLDSYLLFLSNDRVIKQEVKDNEENQMKTNQFIQTEHSLENESKYKDNTSSSANSFSKLAISLTKTENKKSCVKKINSSEAAQRHITDFYQTRRSNRKRKSLILKEQQEELRDKILFGRDEGLAVVEVEGKGRGVVATKDFKKGEFVVEYWGELIEQGLAKQRDADYARDTTIGCYMYYFVYKDRKYCVDATEESGRLGRLINHSKNGNLTTKAVLVDGVPRLILLASRDISAGHELSYDYGDRSREAIRAHPWLAT
ncbi:SET domain containing (Lysine methyltransferase) 8 [Chamberlinius hualienensis]